MRTQLIAVATAATAVAFSLSGTTQARPADPALRAQARQAAQEILHQTGNL